MARGPLDRAVYFEEGLRPEVTQAWQKDPGFSPDLLQCLPPADPRAEILAELEARPSLPEIWPCCLSDMEGFAKGFDPADPKRLPDDWPGCAETWRRSGHVRMMRVHRGFFLSMGVYNAARFFKLMDLVLDDPEFVRACMDFHARFSIKLLRRVLAVTPLEAVVFSEPIGGNDGPLISPDMYETLVLPSYVPVLEAVRKAGISIIIFRTYANARLLVPSILKFGFNCLWACEVNLNAMDYLSLRAEFGPDLNLIGGIDLDVLRLDRAAIEKEVMAKVPALAGKRRVCAPGRRPGAAGCSL